MYRDGYIIPCLKNFFYWHFKIPDNSEVATYNEIIKVAITLHKEKEDAYMAENKKIYITANELAEMLGVSVGHAYKLIRKLNQELEKEDLYEVLADCRALMKQVIEITGNGCLAAWTASDFKTEILEDEK